VTATQTRANLGATNPLSLRDWLAAALTGESYDHPALRSGGSYGQRVQLPQTDSGSLFAGGRILSIADALRPPLILQAAGAQVLEDVSRYTDSVAAIADVEAGWLVTGQDSAAIDVSTTAASLGGAVVTGRVNMSRRFRIQSPTAEALLRQSLARAMKAATEAATLAGSGTLAEPRGLINETAIASATGAVTPASLLDDVAEVVAAGADPERVSIIAAAADLPDLLATGGAYVLNNQGNIPQLAHTTTSAGLACASAPHLATGQAITGQFDYLTVTFYEAPELLLDIYSQSASGQARLSGFQHVGAAVSHVDAFKRRRAS
jgi:HK97 family phage major capsid protein